MSLENLIKNIQVGKTGYAYIVGNEGKIIAHPNEKLIGLDLAEYDCGQETSAASEEQTATIQEVVSSIQMLNSTINQLTDSVSQFKL